MARTKQTARKLIDGGNVLRMPLTKSSARKSLPPAGGNKLQLKIGHV